ncbi:LOW QUALITY PROTEIN: hypothetical protein ACHAWF_004250, partial [Thalassiosira exigua]
PPRPLGSDRSLPSPPSSEDPSFDRAVASTADDAALVRLLCVVRGYYVDPFASPMSQDADEEPAMQGGTHARVVAVDRAVDAFIYLASIGSPPKDRKGGVRRRRQAARQVVILGAKDHREGEDAGGGSPKDLVEDVRWYEVDRPSVIRRKVQVWLTGCMPGGYQCPWRRTKERQHLVGHDVQCPPSDLFDALTHPILGYDQSVPTMYLPTRTAGRLLRSLAKRRQPSDRGNEEGKSDVFVAVVAYDPIRFDDRFKSQLSLEAMSTLSNQLDWFIQCSFDVERGYGMSHAYEWGSSRMKSANVQCDMLDKVEEFVMLMQHYCFVVAICRGGDGAGRDDKTRTRILDRGGRRGERRQEPRGYELCSVGGDSLVGFRGRALRGRAPRFPGDGLLTHGPALERRKLSRASC